MKKLIILPVFALLGACSTTAELLPDQSLQQKIIYTDGKPAVASGTLALVIVSPGQPDFEYSGRKMFEVYVRNNGSNPIDFSPESFQASVDGVSVKTFSYEELAQEEHSREVWQGIALALGAAGRSMSAANSGYSYQTGTVTAYGSGGYATGTYNGYTYNQAAANAAMAQANAQNQADAATFATNAQARQTALRSQILKRNTLLAGQSVEGGVVIELPAPPPSPAILKVSIPINGESHVFAFDYKKVGN